jgi:transcriptional regulator with XRE-family HTH domain
MFLYTPEIRRKVIARFRSMRLGAGESVAEFATHCEVSASTVHRWESHNDPSSPPGRYLLLICQRTDTSPTWVLFGLGPKRLSDVPAMTQDLGMAKERLDIAKRLEDATATVERLEASVERMADRLEKLE